jgi:hypothetical protein
MMAVLSAVVKNATTPSCSFGGSPITTGVVEVDRFGCHDLCTFRPVLAQCRKASRLIRAMLRQVHSSDIFQLPPEGDA